MSSLIQEFIRELEAARKGLATSKVGKQLHSDPARRQLRLLAERYFTIIRPSILPADIQDAAVSDLDFQMQRLVELCHRRGMTSAYIRILRDLRQGVIALDLRSFARLAPNVQPAASNEADQQIVSTLDKIVPSAANSFRQAMLDMQKSDRLSWRGPATDLRECLRETLDHLAPDTAVESQPNFKLEPNTKGPTMKQKVRYILSLRGLSKSQSGSTESAVEAVEESLGLFVRSVYTRSNLSTHTATSRDEVLRICDLVRVVLAELLEIRR